MGLSPWCPAGQMFWLHTVGLGASHCTKELRKLGKGKYFLLCFHLTRKNTNIWEIIFLWWFLLFPYLLGQKPNLSFKWIVLTCSFGIFVSGASSQTKISSQVSQMFHFPVDLWKRNEKWQVEAMLDTSEFQGSITTWALTHWEALQDAYFIL